MLPIRAVSCHRADRRRIVFARVLYAVHRRNQLARIEAIGDWYRWPGCRHSLRRCIAPQRDRCGGSVVLAGDLADGSNGQILELRAGPRCYQFDSGRLSVHDWQLALVVAKPAVSANL